MGNNNSRPKDYLMGAVEKVTVILFLITLLVMFTQVISRYALGVAVPWTDEVSRFSFIVMVFFGAALCQRSGEQVRITIVLDALSPRLRRIFESISDILTILIGIALIVGAVKNAISTSSVRAATVPISFAWLYVAQGTGIFLLVLAAAHSAISKIRATGDK